MLDTQAQSRARATYTSDDSVALHLSASDIAAAPAAPIDAAPTSLPPRLHRGEEGQGCSWRDTKAQSRAGATHDSDVSVALILSASDSAAAPTSPISLTSRLQRGEEGQACSWRDRDAGAEQGALNLLELRQRRVALERLRERRGALVAEMVRLQAAARLEGSGMLVARQGPQNRAGRVLFTRATSASR
jgi:hypothetical protein